MAAAQLFAREMNPPVLKKVDVLKSRFLLRGAVREEISYHASLTKKEEVHILKSNEDIICDYGRIEGLTAPFLCPFRLGSR